ncbi:fatty acid desaturase family protein [Rhizobium sp. MC63]|uniref:Fatty acid desaturase n=2 Tax=Rhizobium TaxID=379 RepID=A0A7W8XDX9_9HYPH|nr:MULTISPECIES: fatty acid desaturase family protein [Rhizobium]MBB5551070.1 fatty acid desaturase [Rhizobium lentis]MBB5561605.1 fatty acid desaturase [Rhizobium lentis]MBB5568189.1 fatty acid desaturase [Rhizobium lentis]MDF0699361.1 fatty acid desaturase family protein [Rhizobium sp. MC63]MEA3519678.1 fatty acid desaturase family protein [Rhizobium sp. MJ31]
MSANSANMETSGQSAALPRDYGLTGASARQAVEAGLVAAEWYHTEVPRKLMKELMQRSDQPAIRDTILWAVLHVAFAAGGIWFWGSWWAVPFWFAYGVMYGSACDARWHECGHGTAFRTRWMNDVLYHICSFQVARNPVNWRWSHARHHTDTIIVGRDPEIAWMHPIALTLKALAYTGVVEVWQNLKTLARNAAGVLSPDEKDYVPESEWPKAVFWARVHMAIYAAAMMTTIGMLIAGAGWKAAIPLLLVGGPRIYGCWHMVMTGLLQHGGLAEDVLDHRLNSRTVYMNPVSRFIYWNMGYHVEHHMFPMVPYHALARLHEAIKHDLPPANTSIWDGYREMFQAIMRQRREPGYYLKRALPQGAKPYREELHAAVPERSLA